MVALEICFERVNVVSKIIGVKTEPVSLLLHICTCVCKTKREGPI